MQKRNYWANLLDGISSLMRNISSRSSGTHPSSRIRSPSSHGSAPASNGGQISSFNLRKWAFPIAAGALLLLYLAGMGIWRFNAIKNEKHTMAELTHDCFTWDNALVYFVLTDRFYNGNKKNDKSYYRKNGTSEGVPPVAAFHGGDIAGLTKKIKYLKALGINAIWITAPYEQVHGWVTGKGARFPHYAFHGYYPLDWTSLDRNMGTADEFRTFVNTCHAASIRVVMDVVLNHAGYNTVEDMITYCFGGFRGETPPHGWAESNNGKWDKNHEITDYDSKEWDKWWGCWARGFDGRFGFEMVGDDNYTTSLAGLPDIVTEKTEKVNIPAFLRTKWDSEMSRGGAMQKYANPSVAAVDWGGRTGDWRGDGMGSPATYIITWLSAWVREYGIDGFRCDTAKYVQLSRWGELKDACSDALIKWKQDDSKDKGDGWNAAYWTTPFWTVGECFGWTNTSGKGEWYEEGKFDSMINFSFNGGSGGKGRCPTAGDWDRYAAMERKGAVLSYVSSHDTGLHRITQTAQLGTMLCLLTGGVQIYYGDESGRPVVDGMGDADMKTRGDMAFLPLSDKNIVHWGKLGRFRRYNPAVGAGEGDGTKRRYTQEDGTQNYIAIGIAGTKVDVPDGMTGTVYNWYDGTASEVIDGSVSFPDGGGTVQRPILVSNKDPKDFAF